LLRLVATAGCSGPSALSWIASARRTSGTASENCRDGVLGGPEGRDDHRADDAGRARPRARLHEHPVPADGSPGDRRVSRSQRPARESSRASRRRSATRSRRSDPRPSRGRATPEGRPLRYGSGPPASAAASSALAWTVPRWLVYCGPSGRLTRKSLPDGADSRPRRRLKGNAVTSIGSPPLLLLSWATDHQN